MSTTERFPTWAAAVLLACDPSTSTTAPPQAIEAPLPTGASAPDLSDDATLDPRTLACAVLASNPELAAWSDSWRAASARAEQPTSLGDLSLSYSFAPGSIGSSAVGYGQLVQIEQSFRLGQASLERRVARAQAEAAGHDVAAKRQELVLVATALFDEYYTLTRALETNAEHRDLVDSLLDTATARYSTGAAPQQDPIQAELELAQIELELAILTAQRKVVAAQINGLLHRPPDTPLPPPPAELAVEPLDADEPDWQRPETEGAVADEQAAEQATTLARRRFSPSVRAMGSYNSMWADVEHRFMVGAGISIPIQVRSLRSGIAAAKAERSATRHRREAIEDAVAVEQSAARVEFEKAHHVVELHRDRLIPTARARVDAAGVGYETDANDFSTLIEAERELRSLEFGYHRALADLNDERAELDYALGRPTDCDEGVDR